MQDIEKIVSNLSKYKSVAAIYLFGSYARGKERPISDIDICVVTKGKLSERIKNVILSTSSDKIDMSLFYELPIAIRFRVFKEGKLLYAKDELTLHRIKVDTIMRYLDFEYFLNRQTELVLNV